MANELARGQSFEERLKDRIKKDIGELLTDDELKTMVHRSVQSIFFDKRIVRHGFHEDEIPPLLHEIVKDCVNERMTEAVKKYISDNSDIVNQYIKEAIADGMGACVLKALTQAMQEPLRNFADAVQDKFQQMGQVL